MESTPTDYYDPFVIVRGGLVENDPTIPVYDLDVLKADFVDEETINEVQQLREGLAAELQTHNAPKRRIDYLQSIIDECDRWLSREV